MTNTSRTANILKTKPKILVTSAAGKTSAPVVRRLLEAGFPVRGFVRRTDARAHALREAGAEIFVGNQFDLRDMRRAMAGVQRAYYCAPMEPNPIHGGAIFAVAAEEAKLEMIAAMSQWLSDPSHPAIATRDTWLTDRLFALLPNVDHVTVDPGWFADNYFLVLDVIAQLGLMPMPLGEGLNAPPSNEDIAGVAAGVLADPGPHLGKSYRPTGPKLLAPDEIAATIGEALGRKVRYQDISEKLFLKALRAQARPPWQISQLRYYVEDYRLNAFGIGAPSGHVEAVTGRPAEDFATIARRYAARPEATRSLSGRLRALGFFARMAATPPHDTDRLEREWHHVLLDDPVRSTDSEAWRAGHDAGPAEVAAA